MSYTAIFGGTFNPFHIGHYEILKALCEDEEIEKVILMPDKIPPHKSNDELVNDKDRIEMCRLVCSDFPKAELCLIEFEREGKSYTYDTVKLLKSRYKDTEFSVVCGGDMIATLDTWYNFDLLKDEVGFIAFNRSCDSLFEKNVDALRRKGAKIRIFYNKITSVSSTSLRKNLNKEFLPPKIYQYIKENGIYD